MKRELMTVLIGATLLAPTSLDAQRRARSDTDRARVDRLDPITVQGRLAGCRGGRGAFACRDRVVYSSHRRFRSPATYRTVRAYRPHRTGRFTVRADWGRVRLRLDRHARLGRLLHQAELRQVLGPHTVNRLRAYGRREGLRGPLRGHWVGTRRRALVLVVSMGRADLAEFVDYDRDGRIDDAYVFERRRHRRLADGW